MESVFETVKGEVSVPEAAEFCGMPVDHSRTASCFFHSDRHPSMRLYNDHFQCFSCHAHGNVAGPASMLRVNWKRCMDESPSPWYNPIDSKKKTGR